jgi:hypothetical protein
MDIQELPEKIVVLSPSRKPYSKPEIEIVTLRPKELLSSACKSSSDASAVAGLCDIPFNSCHDVI